MFIRLSKLKKLVLFSILLLSGLPLVSFADQAQNSSDLKKYFPLAVGNYWIYQFGDSAIYEITKISSKDEDGHFYLKTKSNLGETIEAIKPIGNKLLKFGIKSSISNSGGWDIFPIPQIILQSPLAKSGKWSNRNGDDRSDFTFLGKINLEKVVAGNMQDVIKIKEETFTTKGGSLVQWPAKGFYTISYYAKGVGLIRVDAHDNNKPPRAIKELIEYGNE